MELLDVYDDFGKTTGRVIKRGDKSVKLSKNEHIAVAVIFIENSKSEFLIQKTSKEKGGEYSSTGGHVNAGETPLESIKREVKEEIGINIDNDNIVELGYLLYDMPLRYMFYLRKDIDINSVQTQKEEVEYVKYMNIEEINKIIESKQITESHANIFKKIMEYKNNN